MSKLLDGIGNLFTVVALLLYLAIWHNTGCKHDEPLDK